MAQFAQAMLTFTRDADNNGVTTFMVMYPTHDSASGTASMDFAMQIIGDFFPAEIQAMRNAVNTVEDTTPQPAPDTTDAAPAAPDTTDTTDATTPQTGD